MAEEEQNTETGPTPEEVAALRQQIADSQAEIRKVKLTGMLEKFGAPTAIADVYNGDLDDTKVKEFVQALQIRKENEDATVQANTRPDISKWGTYEQIQQDSTPTGGGDNELEALVKRGAEGIRQSDPKVNKFQVTEEERLEQRRYADDVNKIHREWEREVRLGRAEPAYRGMEGFGGRLDPPRWAYRAQDGEMIGMKG